MIPMAARTDDEEPDVRVLVTGATGMQGGAVARVIMPDTRRILGASARLLSSEAGIVRLAVPDLAVGAVATLTVQLAPNPRVTPRPQKPVVVRPRPAPRKIPWWQFWRRR